MRTKLIFAALVAAGLATATLPAGAGGHEWWRACGGNAYEGCDGIQRGPYARGHQSRGQQYGGHDRGQVRGHRDGRQAHGSRQSINRGSSRKLNVEFEAYSKRTYFAIQNNWDAQRKNGICTCISGICPPDACSR